MTGKNFLQVPDVLLGPSRYFCTMARQDRLVLGINSLDSLKKIGADQLRYLGIALGVNPDRKSMQHIINDVEARLASDVSAGIKDQLIDKIGRTMLSTQLNLQPVPRLQALCLEYKLYHQYGPKPP
jgi:hypothetical protein